MLYWFRCKSFQKDFIETMTIDTYLYVEQPFFAQLVYSLVFIDVAAVLLVLLRLPNLIQ